MGLIDENLLFIKGGGLALAGYVVGLAFKTIERIMGKINYTKDAQEFLKDHARKLEMINKSIESQKDIMKDLQNYAKQNADNAARMAALIDVIVRKEL